MSINVIKIFQSLDVAMYLNFYMSCHPVYSAKNLEVYLIK